VITDIQLPQQYVDAAEAELLQKAQDYLTENSKPRIQYGLTIDENYIAAKATSGAIINYLNLADYLHVLDPDMGIDDDLQIVSFTRDVLYHYRYELTIGESFLKLLKKTPTSTPVTNIGYGQTAAVSAIKSYVNATKGGVFSAVMKQTTDPLEQKIDDLTEKIKAVLPVTLQFYMPYDLTEFYDPELENSKVLAIERNNSFLKFTQNPQTFDLYFDETVYEGEVLNITLRKIFE
jgi:phage-related protein